MPARCRVSWISCAVKGSDAIAMRTSGSCLRSRRSLMASCSAGTLVEGAERAKLLTAGGLQLGGQQHHAVLQQTLFGGQPPRHRQLLEQSLLGAGLHLNLRSD